MPKNEVSRLKVFQAQFGFYDSVVAAPSRPAALRAWGTHQNLFAEGQARETADEAATEAALAHPNVPLRRALGSTGSFEVEPTSRPTVPDLPKLGPAKRSALKPQTKARPKPVPDRSKLEAAERAVAVLDAERRQAEVEFAQRQADLEADIAAARRDYLARRKTMTAAVVSAQAAFRKAGGKN